MRTRHGPWLATTIRLRDQLHVGERLLWRVAEVRRLRRLDRGVDDEERYRSPRAAPPGAAACVRRAACAPAIDSPRPGIARRDEPPVTWISVPPPDSRNVRMPVERNTKACSATAAAQPRKPDGFPHGPAAEALAVRRRAAPTAFTIRFGGPPRRGPARGRGRARRDRSRRQPCRARRARAVPPRSPRSGRSRRTSSRSPGGNRRWLRRGCARRVRLTRPSVTGARRSRGSRSRRPRP